MQFRNFFKIYRDKKKIFLSLILGFSLLVLLMIANELFDVSHLIFSTHSSPSRIIWLDLLNGLLMLIIVAIITIVVLFKKTEKITKDYLSACLFVKIKKI